MDTMPHHPNAELLLCSYPRSRPPLSPRHQAIYVKEYKHNRSGGSALIRAVNEMESWMHRAVSASHGPGAILELGAGTLNHLPFETLATSYDIVEPFSELWKDAPLRTKVGAFYEDVSGVPLTNQYDYIISIAVMEHLTDLPWVIARCGALLRDSGHFQAAIPSEGGFLWGLSWRCTTGVSYRLRTQLDYETVMRHEHVNTAGEIIAAIEYFFEDVWVRRFPLPFHHLSFYTAIDAALPRRDVCRDFCESRRTTA